MTLSRAIEGPDQGKKLDGQMTRQLVGVWFIPHSLMHMRLLRQGPKRQIVGVLLTR